MQCPKPCPNLAFLSVKEASGCQDPVKRPLCDGPCYGGVSHAPLLGDRAGTLALSLGCLQSQRRTTPLIGAALVQAICDACAGGTLSAAALCGGPMSGTALADIVLDGMAPQLEGNGRHGEDAAPLVEYAKAEAARVIPERFELPFGRALGLANGRRTQRHGRRHHRRGRKRRERSRG